MSVTKRTSWYLLSALGVPALSLITLPLFTTKLGPEEFGAFALGSVLSGVVSATATSISLISLPAELGRLQHDERQSFITAIIALNLFTAVVCSLIVFSLYGIASNLFAFELLSHKAIVLAAIGGLFNSIWGACVEILTIEGGAKHYTITSLLQAVVNAMVVSIALFACNDTTDALFWGFVFSGAMGAISAAIIMRRTLQFTNLRSWLRIAGRGSFSTILSSLTENGKLALERMYLSAMSGIVPLGLLAHAQYYKNAAMVALNALSRGILPTALEEARESTPRFATTLTLWTLVQAFVLAAALGFALLGREIIGALTHGKFVEATPYTIALLMILLLQTAAKPHSTLLMACGKGRIHAHLSTLSIIIATLWLFISVPYIGVWGVVTSFLLQIAIHRIGIYRAANRICRIPFADTWVAVGLILIAACAAITQYMDLTIISRIMLCIALNMAILWKLRPAILLMRTIHHNPPKG